MSRTAEPQKSLSLAGLVFSFHVHFCSKLTESVRMAVYMSDLAVISRGSLVESIALTASISIVKQNTEAF